MPDDPLMFDGARPRGLRREQVELGWIAKARMNPLTVRECPRDTLIDLRHHVLRTGLPRETAALPGDELPTTRHLAAFDGDRVAGCATSLESALDGEPAWQLRGMATEPEAQGKGVGRTLFESAARALIAGEGVTLFWCNARSSARAFYEKLGWTVISGEFGIEGVGPHFKMKWRAATPAPLAS